MAVKTQPAEAELLGRFWPHYRRKTIIRAVVSQLVVSILVIGLIFYIHPEIPLDVLAVIVVFSMFTVFVIGVITANALRPLHDLSSALVHVSGELGSDTPPNLNDSYYKRSRLRPLLKQIYDMAAGQGVSAQKTNTGEPVSNVDVVKQLDHTASGIVMMNSARQIVFSNKSAPVLTDANGKRTLNLIFDVDQNIEEWLSERGEHDIHAEKTWRRIANKLTGEPDRRLFDVHVSYEKGSEVETIITLFDRTTDYQPEDDDLDFIAFAAHELRGPITVIRGYLDSLNDELASITGPDEKELFQRLIVSANRLSGYVNNILNASRFDRRHLRMHLSEQKIADIYATIADDMQMRAVAQRRLLSVSFPENLPTVASDVYSMSEVFGNLIDNAIKYSNDGGAIGVTAIANGDFVDVIFADQGIGMPSNVIGNLFHKFYRSHRSRETVAGTGIGLYISKAIVESTGGTISVRSVEGHGSTFTVSLPMYATIADKLGKDDINNQGFIEQSSSGWIKNHGAFRG